MATFSSDPHRRELGALSAMDWNHSLKEGPERTARLLRHKAAWERTYVNVAHPYSRWAEGLLACIFDASAGNAVAITVHQAWLAKLDELTLQAVKERLKS